MTTEGFDLIGLIKIDRLLVCGDRNWSDETIVREVLGGMDPGIHVIHGDCRGADRIAGRIAGELGMRVTPVPADWDYWGPQAGPIRNRKMIGMGPDCVLAFHPDINRSKGTKDCVHEARRRGIPVMLVTGKEMVALSLPPESYTEEKDDPGNQT